MTEIIPADLTTLADHEAVIERGLTTFIEVGTALLAIRDGRLYREEHATFEDYCEQRWGWGRSYAYRLMSGAEAAVRLSPIGDIPQPTAETQVRPLTRLPAEDQPRAWAQAVEAAGGRVPTQAQVEEVVRQPQYARPEPIRRERVADEYSDPDYVPAGTKLPAAWDFMHAIEDLSRIEVSAFELRAAIHQNQAQWVEEHLDRAYSLLNEFRTGWRNRRAS